MNKKLWEKGKVTREDVHQFTVGRDPEFDLDLAPYDLIGSAAHVRMLSTVGLLPEDELRPVLKGLRDLYEKATSGDLKIEEGVEDIHSQVEIELTRALGDSGKKIHIARSRNDQVLVDIKLYLRDQIVDLAQSTGTLARIFLEKAEAHVATPMPGYTHLQVAMPSSYGLWFSAWSESLLDDLDLLQSALRMANRNPLGSGAGYGSAFPIDRDLTTDLLGFERSHVNSVYAQMTRGKTEKRVAEALAAIASTLGRWAMDTTLYLGQNYRFFSLAEDLTTGSSIMPHKKNPDVFEMIRARSSRMIALPNELALLLHNLPSGYHRDLQLTKEILFPAIHDMHEMLIMAAKAAKALTPNPPALDQPIYAHMFSVEMIQDLTEKGIPFRDAYRTVAETLETGQFKLSETKLTTHLGSRDQPGIERIREYLDEALNTFPERFIDVESLFNGEVNS